MRELIIPSGELVRSELEDWQVSFCYYMSTHSGMGQIRSLYQLLTLNKDDSLFSGAVGRTFKFAFERGYYVCLQELCG